MRSPDTRAASNAATAVLNPCRSKLTGYFDAIRLIPFSPPFSPPYHARLDYIKCYTEGVELLPRRLLRLAAFSR